MAASPTSPAPPEAPAPPGPKPRKKRWALRIAAGILLTPIAVAGLGVGYLHTGAGKARVKSVIEERLRERVDGQVDVGVVDYALFGDVKLGDVHVKDKAGVEAVALTSLTVSPSWGDLLGGRIVIDRVALSGVSVHLVKDADGGSNLKRLIKPQPEGPPRKPLDRRIEVKALSIADVGVDITQPDGTRIVVSNVGVEGALALNPAKKLVDVEIGKLGLSLLLDKGAGALKLGVTGLETGVTVKLDGGAGKATLHPLKGHIGVTLPVPPPPPQGTPAAVGDTPAPAVAQAERGFDIQLGALSADVGDDGVGVSLSQLLAGAVALASVEVKGKLTDGKMDGRQEANLLGLKLSGARVNELLGREVLLGDIDIDTHVAGPPDKIELETKIRTAGAAFALGGSIGVADPTQPTYDMALTVDTVDTEKLLAAGLGVARVTVDKVEVSVKGQGQKPESAGATAKIQVTGATARGVRVDGVTIEGRLEKGILHVTSVDAKAIGQRITASGQVELATKRIDLTLGLDGDVGEALGRLKAAGLPIKSNLPRGAVRLPPGDLTVTARGLLAGAIDVTVMATKVGVLGGTVGVDARASILRHDPPLEGGKKVTVTAMDADVKIGGIKLSSILAMRGKKLEGMDGVLSGDVHVEGTPESPRGKLLLGLTTSRADGGKALRLSVTGDVTPKLADLRASLMPATSSEELFGLRAKLPLSLSGQKKGLDPYRPLEVHAQIQKKKLPELWAYVPSNVLAGTIQTLPEGDISLDLDVKGTAAKPDAHLHVALAAKAVFGFPITQKIDLDATLAPGPQGLVGHTNLDVWLDADKPKLVHVGADLDLSRSPVLGPAELSFKAGVDIGPVSPSDLFMAPEETRAMSGVAKARLDLTGNKQDVTGKLVVNAREIRPAKNGQIAADLAVTIGENDTDVDLQVRGADSPEGEAKTALLALVGKIGLAGKKLFPTIKAKEHLVAPLALTLALPRRTVASLAPVLDPPGAASNPDLGRPPLSKVPGDLSGAIAVTGTLKTPLAKGSLLLDSIERLDGKVGGLGVHLDAAADKITAQIGVGLPEQGKAPLTIDVNVPREPLTKPVEGDVVPVRAAIRGKAVDLRSLVPAVALAGTKVALSGALDWNMDVDVDLVRTKEKKLELTRALVKGLLDVNSPSFPIPGTKRAYQDVALHLAADEAGLHLDSLRARESDLEVKGRSVTVKADVTLDKLKPAAATVAIAADKWLLFGPRALGFADAPRGTLTLDAKATADLSKPIRSATVDVKKLELLIPERFERAHQPEDVHAGDIVFLDEGKTKLGKLPVPAALLAKEKEAKEKAARAAKGTPEPAKETGFDITVQIAKGARLLSAPLEVRPEGKIAVKIRPTGRTITGALNMTAGALTLAGSPHPIVKGTLTFDEKNPAGYVDLHFARPMKPAALRGISEASAGDAIQIHMFGPIADRKTVLSGAGSPGALWDVLSMHNVGRERSISEPDLPKSLAADFPQFDSLLVLSFLSTNLPHLLFLDRFAAWADPYDDLAAYGKMTHFEAERYLAGGSVRVRAGARPPSAGRSEAELEIDYLFVNVPRMLLGVGVTGGTRGGGGPGLVWEWSSTD